MGGLDRWKYRNFYEILCRRYKFSDKELFWKNTAGDKSIIKPRFGAACVGIKKYSRGEQIPEKFINSQYIIEEYVRFTKNADL